MPSNYRHLCAATCTEPGAAVVQAKLPHTKGEKLRSWVLGLLLLFWPKLALANVKSPSSLFELKGESLWLEEVKFYEGTEDINYARVVGSHDFNLARGNAITVNDDYIWLHRNQSLNLVMNPGLVTWTLADNTDLTLDCRRRKPPFSGRVVRFHPNGEYHGGCQTLGQKWFRGKGFAYDVRYGSMVELWPDGRLQYASKVSGDSFITLANGQYLRLHDSSEANLFADGRPRFFTPHAEDRITLSFENLGPVVFGSRENLKIAMKFRDSGQLESGGPVEPIQVRVGGKTETLEVHALWAGESGQAELLIYSPNPRLSKELTDRTILLAPHKPGSPPRPALCIDTEGEPYGRDLCKVIVQGLKAMPKKDPVAEGLAI